MSDQKEQIEEQNHLDHIKQYILESIEKISGNIQLTDDFTEMVLNELRHKEILQIQKSYNQPYFTKIVFQENGQPEIEQAYIGRFGLYDRVTLEPKVIDWRSPIANLYYENQFENVEVPIDSKTKLHFDVWLKRQFDIENGEILRYFDSTSGARINQKLINRLQERGEQKLKDIVETIQAEQNEIIRADAHQVVLVQGVAGSGKTTIALHRLAYLAYQYKDRKSFDNFLIIAPNRLFIDYISNVLPDLGVEGVVQTTWEDMIRDFLPKKVRIADQQEKITFFLEEGSSFGNYSKETIAQASLLRGTMAMKALLDKYVDARVANMIPEMDLILSNKHMLTYQEINQKFHHDFQHYPYMNRLQRLIISLKQWKDDCIRQIVASFDKRLVMGSYQETEARIQQIKKRYDASFDHYCKKLKGVDVFLFYRQIISIEKNIAWLIRQGGEETKDYDVKLISNYLSEENKNIEWEDLAALFYLNYRFYGLGKFKKFSHIVVDEAQDLRPFQLYAIYLLSANTSMTILGDTSQSIYAFKGIRTWDSLMDHVFESKVAFKTLKKSYRSTIEIIQVANEVLKHWDTPHKTLAEPELRHGVTPLFIEVENEKAVLEGILSEVARLQAEGLQNIAIIDKRIKQCKQIANQLEKKGLRVHLISNKETRYEGGVSILPIYLSKGMEFDAVILIDPTQEKYKSNQPTDIKLIYVAMTRALHKLSIISAGNLTPLIPLDVLDRKNER